VTHFRLLILTILLSVVSSCYKEVEIQLDPDAVFELRVTPSTQDEIYNSRDSSYIIDDSGMLLLLDDQQLDLKEIRIRGKSALHYQRKSYAVKLSRPVTVSGRDGSEFKQLTRFKLIAMAMDYTYIEDRIGYGLLEEHDLMPLFFRFVELKINGNTQGVYLLVEDPEQYYLEHGSEFILRRGYYHSMDDSDYSPLYNNIPRETYESAFLEIYSSLTLFEGEALYNALNKRLNMEQYFMKMGIDYLLQNGDYSDEVYLFSLISQDEIRFNIIPWDYDDLFKSSPHEVGLTWGVGKLFGDRFYATHQDILDEIGQKMIFSVEDDLDYKIAMDPYLYEQYENTLADLLDRISEGDIDQLFNQVKEELTPFYNHKEIVAQSRFDADETNFRLWEENMAEKRSMLKSRLGEMKEQLNQMQL
jgi:spore coat protein H